MNKDWRSEAACVGMDPEIWFPTNKAETEVARSICRTCPVVGACLSSAMSQPTVGVWGAMCEMQRGWLHKRRKEAAVA